MRVLNSLIVPKSVKGSPLGFFNTHPVAKKLKKVKGETFLKTLKIFKKSPTKPKRGGESLTVPKIGKRGPFWVLYFNLEAFGCVLSTFGGVQKVVQKVVHTE